MQKEETSPELRLILECCRYEPKPGTLHRLLRECLATCYPGQENVCWEKLIFYAYNHGVSPLVYRALMAHTPDMIPPEITGQMKLLQRRIAYRNMLMSAELLRIVKLLGEHGIKTLAFKGPALAQSAYGDITLRQFRDLDLLVGKAEALRAVALLERDGYQPEIVLKGRQKEAFFAAVNVIGLDKPPHELRIETHWELLSKNYAVHWDMIPLWSRARSVDINGVSLPVPSPTDHLLYLCVHGSKHLYQRLEWVNDVDRLVRAGPGPDWPGLFALAHEMGVVRMVHLSLWLCRELLALPLPESILLAIEKDRTACELGRRIVSMQSGRVGKSYGTFRLLWRMRERLRDRLRFAVCGLLLPKFDDFALVVLPKYLFFLYPAVRLYRLSAKYRKRG